MALSQPTNIIPSSFTVGAVDAERDTAQVSWQVNGNSQMTAYKIEFCEHNKNQASSWVVIESTGRVPVPGGFYGTDRFGKPQMITWTESSGKTWHDYASAFKNGKQYKFKITQYWQEGENELPITQIEANVFNTRATPQVLIYLSDSTFQAKEEDTALADGSVLSTSIGYFRASYTQEQGDAVRNVRWQIATATFSNNQWQIVEIISDTGEVHTPTLQFEFNGFFNEQSYAVRCLIESESGQQANNPGSQNDEWIFFTIDIAAQGSYNGSFTLQCLPRENAALLRWTSDEIVPVVSGGYKLGNGMVALDPNTVIQWGTENGFSISWTVAIELNLVVKETFRTVVESLNQAKTVTMTYSAKGLINSVDVFTPISGERTTIAADRRSCTVTFPTATSIGGAVIAYDAVVTLNETPFQPRGKLAQIDIGNTLSRTPISIEGSLTSSRAYQIDINGAKISLNDVANGKIAIILTSNTIYVYSGGKKVSTTSFSLPLKSIMDIQIFGGTYGATFRSVTVYKGTLTDSTLSSLYADEDFKPSWGASQYNLYMTANFEGSLNSGEVEKFRIYRQEVGQNSLYPIFYAPNGNVQLKDYGIVSRKSYTYWLYEYDKNGAYLKGAQCTSPSSGRVATISTCFKSYSLLVCDYDSVNDVYHVRKQYLFALNLSAGSEGNNNTPTLNANYTPYPTRMPSTQNYASGTLQGLIGTIYTVPALVEEIGGRKQTVKPSTTDYFDSVDLEKELKNLSVTPYTLFLRDMSGNLRMIATSNQINMTPDLKKRQLPKTISFPWVEIGDASDVAIIQTPDDEGWDNGGQTLDIRLAADPQTGILTANYPKPYEGTKFYLTGVKNVKK